mmetsp:Transcript_68380/g.160311  ORF Transcript_68380/g.160311 Transcript_68380/m.160311 type:complete len:530 (+) Transcript_68380:41-1630(+)|eukprot:s679_g16.t1
MRCWAWWSANKYSRSREPDYHCISNDSEPFTSRDDDNSSAGGQVGQDKSQQAEGKDSPITDAHVVFDDDMYDSVTLAAFGGVHLQLPGGTVRVHPMWLCLGCLPLFAAQQASLLYMRLGQDLAKPVHGEGVSDELKQILPFAKTLMVYTLGLMLFPELLGACRLLLFVLNPTTWIDIKRFRPDQSAMWAFLWSTPVLVSCAATAELLKLSIGYVVLVDSVSVVLVCDTVQDTLFNSLALTFLVDLDNKLWEVAKSVFGIEYKEKMLNLQLISEEQARKEGTVKREDWEKWEVFRKCSWLRRAQGGSAVEALLVCAIFMFAYVRQMLVMLYSLKTDTLPVARDMCTIWNLTEEDSFLGMMTRRILRLMSLYAHPNGLLNQTCNPEVGGYCSEQFRAITGRDMWDLAMERPLSIAANVAGLVCVLLVPQIFQLLLFCETDGKDKHSRCFGFIPTDEDQEDEPCKLEKDCAELQQQADASRKYMESLNAKVEDIRMRLNLVCGTSRMLPPLLASQADLSEAGVALSHNPLQT